jgi:hypothetical protein
MGETRLGQHAQSQPWPQEGAEGRTHAANEAILNATVRRAGTDVWVGIRLQGWKAIAAATLVVLVLGAGAMFVYYIVEK